MYKLELEKIISKIKEQNAKEVLIQLPDGMKQKAADVAKALEKETGAEISILFGSCFGACDLPLGLDVLNIDLIVQWGHNKFNKEEW